MIHPCAEICGNKTASGYCATTVCINPKYSNIGTTKYGQGVQKRVVINADRIRAMSDDMQLALFFASVSGCPHCDRGIALNKCESWNDDCVSCWLDWLKQEVDNA